MARVIEVMPGKGYDDLPWKDWFDGQVWELTQGVDFDRDPNVFRGYVSTIAKRMGVKVTVKVREARVYVQAEIAVEPVSENQVEPVPVSRGSYDWNKWETESGSVQRGVDFSADKDMNTFRSTFTTHFRRLGYEVTTSVSGDRMFWAMSK